MDFLPRFHAPEARLDGDGRSCNHRIIKVDFTVGFFLYFASLVFFHVFHHQVTRICAIHSCCWLARSLLQLLRIGVLIRSHFLHFFSGLHAPEPSLNRDGRPCNHRIIVVDFAVIGIFCCCCCCCWLCCCWRSFCKRFSWLFFGVCCCKGGNVLVCNCCQRFYSFKLRSNIFSLFIPVCSLTLPVGSLCRLL